MRVSFIFRESLRFNLARGSSFCPVSGENALQKYTPLPFSQPTMSFDVVGQEEDAHETKCEEMCCPNVRQEVGAKTLLAHAAFTHSEGFNLNGSIF